MDAVVVVSVVVVSVVLLLLGIRIGSSDGSVDLVANTSLLATIMMDHLLLYLNWIHSFVRQIFRLLPIKFSLGPCLAERGLRETFIINMKFFLDYLFRDEMKIGRRTDTGGLRTYP